MDSLIALAFCFFALAGIFGICWLSSLDQKRENANFHQGEEALKRGDFDLALACANEEIRRDPKRVRGFRMRGQALHQKGIYRQAIEDYSQAIRLAPQNGRLYLLRGESCSALRLWERAIADYSDAIRLNPADTAAIERRRVASAEWKALGDVLTNVLPDKCAITTDPSFACDDSASTSFDRFPLPQTVEKPTTIDAGHPAKLFNRFALTGFILGLASVVLYDIGIIPILGIIFSAIGLGRFNAETQKAKWMAGWGLALSILYTLMYLTHR